MSSSERLPPQNREAEEAILGSLLIDPDAIFDVHTFLKADAFYSITHRWIYEAILSLYDRGEAIDSLTVIEELRRRDQLEDVGGEAYIVGLVSVVPTSINAASYGRIVEAAAVRRDLLEAASNIAQLAFEEEEDINIVLDRAEQKLFSISEQRTTRDLVPVRQIAEDYLARIEELHAQEQDIVGVPTGFTDLDRLLGGLNKSDLVILAARPGMGKCVTADTRLVDPHTGALTDIETLVQRQNAPLVTLNKQLKLVPGEASHFVDSGIKPVYRVTTALGREIKTTLSHPFLTIEGWKPLHDIGVGERVAVPRQLPIFGHYDAPEYETKVLGYLLGDGCLTGSSPQFTNSDPVLREDFTEAALTFCGNKARIETSNNQRTPTVYITQDRFYKSDQRSLFAGRLKTVMAKKNTTTVSVAKTLGVAYGTVEQWRSGRNFPSAKNFSNLCRTLAIEENELLPKGHAEASQTNNSLVCWLKEIGIWGKSAAEKAVPDVVFTYTRSKIALFLNRLFACDGSIYLQGQKQPVVSYTTASKRLAADVRHLLLRFGIIAKLRRRQINYRDGHRIAYQLRITDANSMGSFANEIGALGKEDALTAVCQRLEETSQNVNRDTVPIKVWDQIALVKGTRSWASISRALGFGDSHNLHVGQRSVSRERLAAIGSALESQPLLGLANSDVYWDEVVSIEPLGKQQVYDLCVPKTHNFVADDMIVHNTSLQNGIALTAARTFGQRVAIFNLEMSGEQLVQRMLASETRIDIQRLRRGNLQDHEWPIFYEAVQRLSATRIFIDDTPSITPLQLRTKCRRLYAEHGIDLVMIDYLQLMQADRSIGNRVQEIGDISRGLKQLAREIDVPVLAAAQLSRGVESRQDKRPLLSDLRDSGSIEQDADIVMFIYRDEYYNPETTDRPNIAEINVAKHRNGPTATVDLYWNGELASFANLQRQEVNL
ncbi:MAG: replicative DNA helicase [Ardenticatenaceae bacterium]|nr:replicative DNA helicase [Ardenticatenaceae bacterium]